MASIGCLDLLVVSGGGFCDGFTVVLVFLERLAHACMVLSGFRMVTDGFRGAFRCV